HRRGEGRAKPDDEKAIDGVDAADQGDRSIESGGGRKRAHLAAPDLADDIDDHQRDTDRQQDLVEVPPAQTTQEQRLEHKTEQREGQRRDEQREPERPGELDDGERDVRTEHVEGAVGEVDHVHHPEHQREAGGEDEKQGAERETVQRLLKYELGAHDLEASYFPASATFAILSLIVFTVCPFCVLTSRMQMSWIGMWVLLSNAKSPR